MIATFRMAQKEEHGPSQALERTEVLTSAAG